MLDEKILMILQEQNELLREIRDCLKIRKSKVKDHTEALFDFNATYKLYPRKEGKTLGISKLAQTIKTKEQYDLLMLCTKRYKEKVERDKTEQKFMLLFSTFAGRWQDYLPLEDNRTAPKQLPPNSLLLI
jgi:hypothetical protein